MEEIIKKISILKARALSFRYKAKKVSEVCTDLARSWSGSSLVGHAKYYYGNFEEPSSTKRFNIEWGLINGVPHGWIERSADEVRAKIEKDSGTSMEDMSNLATELENGFTDMQREAVLQLSENGLPESDIEKIENFSIRSAVDIFNDIFPTKFMTRDAQSATGNYYAPHIYYEAVAKFISNFPDEVKSFLFELEKITRKKLSSKSPDNSVAQTGYYVENSLILSLSSIKSQEYDLIKLVKMCKELNDNYSLANYLACGMLIRAILDHVPPLFGKKTFAEVANNHGTKSFKDIILPLEDTARKISDSYLHNPIKKKEILPSKTQVSFQPNMDVLLSEIVRILSSP